MVNDFLSLTVTVSVLALEYIWEILIDCLHNTYFQNTGFYRVNSTYIVSIAFFSTSMKLLKLHASASNIFSSENSSYLQVKVNGSFPTPENGFCNTI